MKDIKPTAAPKSKKSKWIDSSITPPVALVLYIVLSLLIGFSLGAYRTHTLLDEIRELEEKVDDLAFDEAEAYVSLSKCEQRNLDTQKEFSEKYESLRNSLYRRCDCSAEYEKGRNEGMTSFSPECLTR